MSARMPQEQWGLKGKEPGFQDPWDISGPHVQQSGGVWPAVSSPVLLTCGVKSGPWACMVLEAAFLGLSLFVISCMYIR